MPPPSTIANDPPRRRIQRETDLGGCTIIHPATSRHYRQLAAQLAAVIGRRHRPKPACFADTDLMPERATPLPDAYRARALIVLGNLNDNRTLAPLYANYLCSTDAVYPGGDGCDLRTIVNPYGTGANVILAGGSSLAGVEQAVEKLRAAIIRADRSLLPFLFDVTLDPGLAASLAAWPCTPLDDSTAAQALRSRGLMFSTEPIRVIGAYTLMWSWTGDARYAHIARDSLRALNARMTDGYGDWHYLAERFLRALPLLTAGGFLNAEDIARTHHLLMRTALGNENEWWRMRTGRPPLGHRHHGKGTYEFLLLARYLRDQTDPAPPLRTLCDRWIGECHVFLDALAVAGIDDQDDESTLNNLATLYRYALGEERHAFFTGGNARRVAERCLALHDNNGNGAGQGGYGESQGMYLQQEATEQTACSAFYYGDGRLKWILQTMPNLALPQRYFFLCYTPAFVQKFATGPELAFAAPSAAQGVTCLPVTPHQLALSQQPPVHVEPAGHMVNAPETWQLAEGIGLNRLAPARGFDKLVLRGGYARDDTYLLIQGYQGGFRWQGHMQAANAIVRFYQAGHVWLVQNTSRHSYCDKNALFISDGANAAPMPPIAERVAVADFPALALTVTRVAGYHDTDWTRHLFWSRTGEDCFVVIDRVVFNTAGPHSLTCTWRTPAYAELNGRRWHSDQGAHRFTLVNGTAAAATCEVDADQGACSPYVLRQRRAGTHCAGEETSFQNLFQVRARNDEAAPDLRQLDACSAVVQRGGVATAWCAVALTAATRWLPEAEVQARSAWVEASSLTFAGVQQLALVAEGLRIESDRPVQVRIDLAAAAVTLQTDAAAGPRADVVMITGTSSHRFSVEGQFILPLAMDRCDRIARAIANWFGTLHPAAAPAPVDAAALPAGGWHSHWVRDSGRHIPEVVRNVCVTADPLPVNGSPDELLNPVLPDGYSREIWTQWPAAAHYDLTLTLPAPRPLTALNLLGDCLDDPTLRTFNPLPEGITVTAGIPDAGRQACAVTAAPDRPYKRYRDAENRLQVRTAAIGATVRSLHIRIPAPAAGRPFVLHRLEVLGDGQQLPAVEQWCAADLDGDGQPEIAFVNANRELIVLDIAGRERWRQILPVPATHLSPQPLDAAGPPVLCVGLLGGDLRLYHPDGTLRQLLHVAEEFQTRQDCLQGWYNATHSLAIWHRDAAGRGCLVLGGYAILVFLNADGAVVGHSFSDGPWNQDILVAGAGRSDHGDLYVRCGWNHGIQYYQGVAGADPSGEVFHLGGFKQPMFRMLKRVIPFLNGRSLAATWIDLPALPAGAMFFATELGCGVLSTATKDWHWKLEGGLSLNAAVIGRLDDRPVALLGGRDGFVAALDLADGQVLRRQHVGAPVIGLNPAADGRLLVATQTGVQLLNRDWQPVSALPRNLNRALPLGNNRLLVSAEDHTLELLELSSG